MKRARLIDTGIAILVIGFTAAAPLTVAQVTGLESAIAAIANAAPINASLNSYSLSDTVAHLAAANPAVRPCLADIADDSAIAAMGQPLLGDGVRRASRQRVIHRVRPAHHMRPVDHEVTINKPAVRRAGTHDNTSSARAAHLPAHSHTRPSRSPRTACRSGGYFVG